MRPENVRYLSQLLEKSIGLKIGENKDYLWNARLTPLVEKYGVEDIDGLIDKLRPQPSPALLTDIVDAMTTNETSFFRDEKPFEMLYDHILPELLKTRGQRRQLRIWNAACSSGQEPYSLVMGMLERCPEFQSWRVDILATDVNKAVLEKAAQARYNHFEIQRGLPIQYLLKYFTQEKGKTYQLKDEIKARVQYKYLNLLESFTGLGKFDIIFCRNVLIYFDAAVKKDILERMCQLLDPQGYLILGGTETILGVTEKLERKAVGIGVAYQHRSAQPQS